MLSLLLLTLHAQAGTFAGVTMPDTTTVAGQTVVLNGQGLREKFFFDIYVGGMYVTTKTHDASTIINDDKPKKMLMHFVYSEVTKDQMIEAFDEGFGAQPGVAAQGDAIAKVKGWLPPSLKAGDELAFEYAPGVGTTMYVNSKAMGTIPGAEFGKVVFGIYVGTKPPTEDLKKGLLGNK